MGVYLHSTEDHREGEFIFAKPLKKIDKNPSLPSPTKKFD